MSDYFPDIVIVDILSRLPVKSLIRFRCVSKYWFSLISSHYFNTEHRNRTLSNTTKDSPYLLFSHYDLKIEKVRFAWLSSDDPFPLKHFSKHLDSKLKLGVSDGGPIPDPPIRRILMKQAKKRGFFRIPIRFCRVTFPIPEPYEQVVHSWFM